MKRTLEDYTVQDLAELATEMGQSFAPFMDALRVEGFERRSNEMVTPNVATWAKEMEAKHGPKVRWNWDVLSWPAALAAITYSGNINLWPERFDAAAEHRAHRWATGQKIPTYITHIVP